MNDPKKQNRFVAFLKPAWQQTRLCVKSFLVAVFILALLIITHAVVFYLFVSSGGLNLFVGYIAPWLWLGLWGLSFCLIFWTLICLIVSVVNIKKPANIVFTVLGIILVFAITNLCSIVVYRFLDRIDIDIARYYGYSIENIDKVKKFSQEIRLLSKDEKFTFTEQSINDLSEKLSPYDRYIRKYVFHYPDFDFNNNLLGLKPSEIHTDVVMLFQSENDESSFSNSNNISAKWHYGRGSLIVFGDGRLEFIKKENFKNLCWKP